MAYYGYEPVGCVAVKSGNNGSCEMKRLFVKLALKDKGITKHLVNIDKHNSCAYVKCICDGKYDLLSPMTDGQPVNYGRTVRLICDNVDIIVVENAFQVMDEGTFLITGINFREYNLIALKSSVHFRAYFRKFTNYIITVDPLGLSTGDLGSLNLKNVRRPIFPLDI